MGVVVLNEILPGGFIYDNGTQKFFGISANTSVSYGPWKSIFGSFTPPKTKFSNLKRVFFVSICSPISCFEILGVSDLVSLWCLITSCAFCLTDPIDSFKACIGFERDPRLEKKNYCVLFRFSFLRGGGLLLNETLVAARSEVSYFFVTENLVAKFY